MDTKCAKMMGLKIRVKPYGNVSLADKRQKTKIKGKVVADVIIGEKINHNVQFTLLDGLVAEIIVGLDLLKKHKSVTLEFNGASKPLVFGSCNTTKRLSVVCSKILYPTLFPGLSNKSMAFSQSYVYELARIRLVNFI